MSKKLREKNRFVSGLKKLGWILLLIVISIAVFDHYRPENVVEREVKVVVEKNVGVSLEKKIAELKSDLLDDLRTAEIKGYEHLEVIIVFDPLQKDLEKCRQVGGVRLYCYSFGEYNFKIATVQHYYQIFYGYTPGDSEAMNIALDDDRARELAHKVIFEEVGGIWNWKNSADKISAADRITFIRSLEN